MEKAVEKNPINEEYEKKKLIGELVSIAKEVAPTLYKQFHEQVYEPNEDASGISAEVKFWGDMPWAKVMGKVVYAQIYNDLDGHLDENDKPIPRPLLIMQRHESAMKNMRSLMARAERSDWTPLELCAKSVDTFSRNNFLVLGYDKGRVTPADVVDELTPFFGDTYATRYSAMKTVFAICERNLLFERDMFKICFERGLQFEEWNFYHIRPELDDDRKENYEAIKKALTVINEPVVERFVNEAKDAKIKSLNVTAAKELGEVILDIYAWTAASMGYTYKNLPDFRFVRGGNNTPIAEMANVMRDGESSYTRAHYTNENGRGGLWQTCYLYADYCLAKYILLCEGTISNFDFILSLRESIAHELNHERLAHVCPAYSEFAQGIENLRGNGVFGKDDYNYRPDEVAAFKYMRQIGLLMHGDKEAIQAEIPLMEPVIE